MNQPTQVNEPQASYGAFPASAGADLRGSLPALQRAARRARQVAQQTGTDLIVQRGGQVVRIKPQQSSQP